MTSMQEPREGSACAEGVRGQNDCALYEERRHAPNRKTREEIREHRADRGGEDGVSPV